MTVIIHESIGNARGMRVSSPQVAEDLIKASGVPYVLVRAPAFLDQSADYVADGVKAGRFHAIGDKATKWSYVLTDDLASHLAKAATYHGNDIINQTIDIGWRDGPKSQQEIAGTISDIMKRRLAIWVVPWLVFRLLARPVRLFSELGYDFIQMFLFFSKGGFVANFSTQERFFGPAPTSRDAITRWARSQQIYFLTQQAGLRFRFRISDRCYERGCHTSRAAN